MGTNLISGIMAIVMMLTAVCGGLGQAKVEQPVTVEIGVGLDGEIPEGMISGTTPEMAASISMRSLSAQRRRVSANMGFDTEPAWNSISGLTGKSRPKRPLPEQ